MRNHFLGRWFFVAFSGLLASSAAACSGANVQVGMIYAEAFGKIGFGVNAMLSVIAFSGYRGAKRGPGHPAILTLLLICHPTFYVSPYRGDCGFGLESATTLSFGLMLGLLMWQLAVSARSRSQ
ncbi:MAG TPA: hypothetical protein VK171_16860 [Fimbriimonas sp.]|nr:hypothetical protein [Fimbriimonas sp.]